MPNPTSRVMLLVGVLLGTSSMVTVAADSVSADHGVAAGGDIRDSIITIGYTPEQAVGKDGHALFHHSRADGSPYPVNKAGFVQHSYFHRHVPWAEAIVHTHTTATMAVCSLEGGLQPVNFYACNFAGRISYHDFEGITVRAEEGERLLKNLGDNRVLMLRNHGPVILGRSIPEIFVMHWALQRACEVQLATMAAGKPVVVSDAVVAVHHRDLHEAHVPGHQPGGADFDAWVRRIDKTDRSWRD